MGGRRLCDRSTAAPNSNTALGGFLSHRESLPAINIMLGAVLQAAPGLYGGLVVGLQNASEGDSRVFLNSWNAAFAMGLLSAELIVTVQEIVGEYDLPESFIEALAPAE